MLVATLMRWLMLALIIVGVAWLLRAGFGKLAEWVERRVGSPAVGAKV
jgi:hypothetical protein